MEDKRDHSLQFRVTKAELEQLKEELGPFGKMSALLRDRVIRVVPERHVAKGRQERAEEADHYLLDGKRLTEEEALAAELPVLEKQPDGKIKHVAGPKPENFDEAQIKDLAKRKYNYMTKAKAYQAAKKELGL